METKSMLSATEFKMIYMRSFWEVSHIYLRNLWNYLEDKIYFERLRIGR